MFARRRPRGGSNPPFRRHGEFRRRRRDEVARAAVGVTEAQPMGVQHQARGGIAAAVEPIAENWMAEMDGMRPELVLAAGLGPELDQRGAAVVEDLDHPVGGRRRQRRGSAASTTTMRPPLASTLASAASIRPSRGSGTPRRIAR